MLALPCGSTASLYQDGAAVDYYRLAGDVVRGIGGQETRHAFQFAIHAASAHGDAGAHQLPGLLPDLLRHAGGEVPGRNGVDTNSMPGPLGRQFAGEGDQATFGCYVTRGGNILHWLAALNSIDGSDVDDAAV